MAGVHYSNRLEDQAASAALSSHKETGKSSVLDEDGKLSSASAATSLKYANAKDLPSFPSAGLKLSSAGAAASLADSNKKSFEHWKPNAIPAANRAALLAKDYEMDPLWQPELSAAGSKAALLAHKDTPSVEIWRSEGTQAGHSAAGQALKMKSPNAIVDRNIPADQRQKALMAATGAMAGNRPRAGSTPVSNANAGGPNWALKAATSSQKGAPNSGPFASGDPGFEAARIQNIAKNNVNRQMYGSAPPVAIEVEEKNRQDTLRASAIAMARKMYAIQQSHIDEAAGVSGGHSTAAATTSHRRNLSDTSSNAGDEPAARPRYENLEEAARKLAHERLAKMRDEHEEYRQYYGATSPPPRSKLSMRLRRRASTGASRDEDDSSEDEVQARRVRNQMSIFQSKVAEVDKKKQQADRNALLEIAHRNVEARMAKMDQQVFESTGKSSPAQKELWEQQARERAQKSADERMQNVGKVHIGGGKYLDQSEVDAIARARLQPTLDEISDTAEKQRARDEEIRLEHQRAQEQLAKEKAREAEVKAEVKAAHDLEKAEAKKKKLEEKQASKEQANTEKERLRKEKEERQAVAAEEKEKARQEKNQKQAEVAADKEKKQAEAAAEKERARLEKEENRKSVEVKPGRFNSILKGRNKEETPDESEGIATTAAEPAVVGATVTDARAIPAEGETVHDAVTVPQEEAPERSPTRSIPYEETVPATEPVTVPVTSVAATTAATETPTSPSKRDSKMKSWFKSHLKGSSKAPKEEPTGGALRTVASEDVDTARDESIRDVAMAGRETSDLYGTGSKEEQPISPIPDAATRRTSRSSSISSISTPQVETASARPLSGTEHTAQVGTGGLKAKLLKKVRKDKGNNEAPRESFVTSNTTDDESYEEAQDKIEDSPPVLPPSLTNARAVSPRVSHENSKFTEVL